MKPNLSAIFPGIYQLILRGKCESAIPEVKMRSCRRQLALIGTGNRMEASKIKD